MINAADKRIIARALISVSDKSGIVELAAWLHHGNVEILSTGGTAAMLMEAGIPVTEVAAYTGFPEMMDGRVKTLHPRIHGGILGRRGTDESVMDENGIKPIDLVVVNLYPFEDTVSRPECSLAQAIENIDIGGPTMVRAAAKNHADVTVVVDASDYQRLQGEMDSGGVSAQLRFDLAVKAFEHTAKYDGAIANYLGMIVDNGKPVGFPRTFNIQLKKSQDMRYGENPHQAAAFYVSQQQRDAGISTIRQIQGKALSYNNIADTDAAIECVKQFADSCTCVIVKHANPCGVAQSDSVLESYRRAYSTDPESAFGGIIAFNRAVDGQTVLEIASRQFVEVIVAPEVDDRARTVIAEKKNVRLLECGYWKDDFDSSFDYKRVNGGLLVQDSDQALYDKLEVVTEARPDEARMKDLAFAWKVAKYVKSNAIIFARDSMTIGVGAGQMSRVNSARIAAIKAEHAGLAVSGSVMASDAFFPFRDAIDAAAEAGISAVIQPGGSMRDDEVVDAANQHGIAMVFTGMRHFRH